MSDEAPDLPGVTAAVSGDPSAPTIRLAGELDLAGAAEVRACFAEVLAAGPERLVVDLSGLDFIDSSGLSILIEAARTVPVRVENPTDPVRRVFAITGLDELWEIGP